MGYFASDNELVIIMTFPPVAEINESNLSYDSIELLSMDMAKDIAECI